MNTVSLEPIEIAAGRLSHAIQLAKESLSSSVIRNHPERRKLEDELTTLMPSLPKLLAAIAQIDKKIKLLHK